MRLSLKQAPLYKGEMTLKPRLTVFICTFIGASTIVIAEPLVKVIPPFYLLGARFFLAATLLAIFFPKKVFPLSRASIRAGLTAGAGFGAGCAMLYLSLPHVRAGKLTFLIALEVVIVPLLSTIFLKQKARKNEQLALLPAVIGLWLITGDSTTAFTWWELVVLMSAFAYAIYTISLSHNPGEVRLFSRTFVSFLLIGAFSLSASLLFETFNPALWGSKEAIYFLYLVVIGSILRFLLQSWAQRHVSAAFTALTFTAEPVFAIFLSYIFLGERFTPPQSLGASLIVAALIISNFPQRSKAPIQGFEV